MSETTQGAGTQAAGTQAAGTQAANRTVRDIGILVVITLAAGMLLGAAYTVTKEPIARAQQAAREQAQRAVMEDAAAFMPLAEDAGELTDLIQTALEEKGLANTRVEQVDLAQDGEGRTTGYVVTCTNSEGYGGDVELMCGIVPGEDRTLTIEGISFLSLTETAGMGMRAKDEEFISQFDGIQIRSDESLVYTKSGASAENEIDAISGCTVTTSAVTKDVNAALEAVRTVLASDGAIGASAEGEA